MLLSEIEYDIKNDRINSIQGPYNHVHMIIIYSFWVFQL